MKKIFISGKIPKIAYEVLSKKYDVTMHDDLRPLTKEEIIEGIKGKDALLCILSDKIDREIIESNPKLKIIANYGAGFDNIDIQTASEHNIYVTNTPLVSTVSTAELTLGLMLGISRRIAEGDRIMREGSFAGWAPLYQLGTELSHKTLGIIGIGNIGKAVAKRAKAFDMDIIYYNRTPLSKEVEREYGVRYASLDELISTSDYITLHVSYNTALHHIIDEKALNKMKSSAYLINAARGPLVDEAALLNALKNKIIAGAALDVFEFEPNITKGLESLDNVLLTPHIGNATHEARGEMAQIAAYNIIDALKGDNPRNAVNQKLIEVA